MMIPKLLTLSAIVSIASAAPLATCPGYRVTTVQTGDSYLIADLTLAGTPCNLYSEDITNLRLTVEYQTDTRLHVLIEDRDQNVYQIQDSILPRPSSSSQNTTSQTSSDLRFTYQAANPFFSFKITRASTGDVLFDTSPSPLIFETQYLRLRTRLPPNKNPNLYGLGEHSDSFRLPVTEEGYKRTLWNSEAPYIPQNQNLYGSHPVYFDHRADGTHGVFLRNAAGMDIVIGRSDDDGEHSRYLEYNAIGGVFDFYFLAGPKPEDVSRQYAEVVGLPAMMPYWSLGFHQCKYGWPDLDHVRGVVRNYSEAGIPLEAVWGDVDYMDGKLDFTTDPGRYPREQLREFVEELHGKGMRYVQILDPGIRYKSDYGTYQRGAQKDVFLKAADGSCYRGLQWPGEVVWPDWIAPQTTEWWTTEILTFYDPNTGIDIDGLWIDMNEASNMCADTTCLSSAQESRRSVPIPVRGQTHLSPRAAADGKHIGLPNRDLFTPPYSISNHYPSLSSRTLFTNITNSDGTSQYDTHNLHGLTMSMSTHRALLSRSPTVRPFLLTRSTFSGSSKYAAHWFGDNFSSWADYRASIRQLLSFSAIHNYPMVGSDVCGFNGPAQEKMCARWAVLGAWHPFYRNHADVSAPDQEFYRWGSVVAGAARKAVATRYRLLDYIYTGLHYASKTGEVLVKPLWFLFPEDEETYGIDTQFFLGEALLVSPVVEDDVQSVSFYLPRSVWYDFFSHSVLDQSSGGQTITVEGVDWDSIPVYIRGGSILPLRLSSPESPEDGGEGKGQKQAMTTKEVRERDFEILVAPDEEGKARGRLYLDDGESMEVGGRESEIEFLWEGSGSGGGRLEVRGVFGYETEVRVRRVVVLDDGRGGGKKVVEGGGG
ncbi:glycosyl hydrolases family 31-domain-containing protein [Sordaria brevicollis]|uniref:alpha-glucosidase n=1 Tax=Sordaria brevicollis TaxID=83679 RepID=A0AAE0NRF3_SORBR|nr:glycosyl hydrolases family 31-domain-containing protein [Sordaria brevicollis]